MVGTDSKQRTVNVGWQMPIAQMPREPQKLSGIGVPDFDQALLGSVNPYPAAVFELQAVPVGHRHGFRKIQQDHFTVIQSELNPSAVPHIEIERDSTGRPVNGPPARGTMNGYVLQDRHINTRQNVEPC